MNDQSFTPLDYNQLFTKRDFTFLLQVFKKKHKTQAAIAKVLSDPITRYQLLSHPELFQKIQEAGCTAPVSSYLFYATQITHILESSGIHEHLMIESLSVSITKVAQNIRQKTTGLSLERPHHIPLMMMVGIRDKGSQKEFQILGDLKKACVVIEGLLTEKPLAQTNPPWSSL